MHEFYSRSQTKEPASILLEGLTIFCQYSVVSIVDVDRPFIKPIANGTFCVSNGLLHKWTEANIAGEWFY